MRPRERGLAWGEDDTIYVTPRDNTGVWRVPASGGTLEQVTTLADGDVSHRWPHVLPDGAGVDLHHLGRGVGSGARSPFSRSRAARPRPGPATLDPLHRRRIGEIRARTGCQPGIRSSTRATTALMSVPFDRVTPRGHGQARRRSPIGSMTNFSGGAQFAVSPNGMLALRLVEWRTGGTRAGLGRRATARLTPAVKLRGIGRWFDLSPDGRRVVRYKGDGATGAVWIDDLAGGASTRGHASRRGVGGTGRAAERGVVRRRPPHCLRRRHAAESVCDRRGRTGHGTTADHERRTRNGRVRGRTTGARWRTSRIMRNPDPTSGCWRSTA